MNWQKTDEEIEIMKNSGKITATALKKVLENIKPGVTCSQLDAIAKEKIESQGAKPSFMTVDNYGWTICTTVNEQVVHAIPTGRVLKEGDVVGIDIGAVYKGFHSDLAITVPVGHINNKTDRFLKTGKNTLEKAIKMAKEGNCVGDISETIQKGVETAGHRVVESLTGHGVGKDLHEDPLIPGVGKKNSGPKLLKNMTLAIEVIYAEKSSDVVLEQDGWTISTRDKSLAGLFEQTVAIGKNGPIVLTPYI